MTLLNYVEQNPLRAKLKQWKYVSSNKDINDLIDDLPIELPENWEEVKKEVLNKKDKYNIDNSIKRQSPYGDDAWVNDTAYKYDIVSTINPRGRPKKIVE